MESRLRYPTVILVGLMLICAVTGSTTTAAEQISMSLSEAVQTALLNNLGLRLKQQDVIAAEGQVMEAKGTFSPLLSADLGATGERNRVVSEGDAAKEQTSSWQVGIKKKFMAGTEVDLSFNSNTLDTDSNYLLFDPVYRTGLSVDITQPLLQNNGTEIQTAALNAAQRTLEAQTFLVDDEAAALAARVKNAYWELVFAHQHLAVLQLSQTLAEKLRDETTAMIEAGKLADIDRFQPESEVALREQDVIAGEQAIGVAEDLLKQLLNSSDWHTPLLPIDQPDITAVSLDLDDIINRALNGRPDIKAAALQIKAAQWRMKQAENTLLPSLDFRGGTGFGGTSDSYTDAVDTSFNDNDYQWYVGLSFSHPLDNSAAEGRYRQAAAQYRKARTQLEILKQEVRRLVRTAVRNCTLAVKTISAAEKTTMARQKSLEAEQTKFAAGRSTTLDVLTAQQMYAQALSAQHRAKVLYVQTIAEIDRLQGIVALQ